jgi:transposase
MTSESKKTRRRYGAQFKAMVLAQCEEPGVSVAQVAMSHGIDDNVVHRWRQLAREGEAAPQKAGEFIALPMKAAGAATSAPADIHVELRRGHVTMIVTWPASAAADFAIWTRELLRMIRVDSVWLAVRPLDMRLGTEAALARVVTVFGAAHPHHAYLFANRRANRAT